MSSYGTLSPEDFSRKAWQLYRKAVPSEEDKATFQRAISLAKAKGMSRIEGVEFAIRLRRGEVE